MIHAEHASRRVGIFCSVLPNCSLTNIIRKSVSSQNIFAKSTMASIRLVSVFSLAVLIILIVYSLERECFAEAAEITKVQRSSYLDKFNSIFSNLKKVSFQGIQQASGLLVSVPFGKILLAGGALLSLFFIFIRLIIVLSPIFLLGALTRESTDFVDLFEMLIEFYNRVVMALDDQALQSSI